MPNKDKSMKSLPNSSGDLISAKNVSNKAIEAIQKSNNVNNNNNSRKKTKSNKMTDISAGLNAKNDVPSTNDSVEYDEIRAVSDELLRRLHMNGTSVSVLNPNKESGTEAETNQIQSNSSIQNNETTDSSYQNNQSKRKQKPMNNNSNVLHNRNDHKKCHQTHQECTKSNISTDDPESENVPINKPLGCNGVCGRSEDKSESSIEISSSSQNMSLNGVAINLDQPSTSNISKSEPEMNHHSALSIKSIKTDTVEIQFKEYENELQMPDIMRVIQRELSEPYSIYTYRYFIHNWPKLCFLAMDGENCIGAIVCKLDVHRQMTRRGYIAMLAVDAAYRKLKIGTTLVQKAIEAMLQHQADEVVLETEITNIPALKLYENLGFVRDKRLFDYYLNGVDALRLKLWFK